MRRFLLSAISILSLIFLGVAPALAAQDASPTAGASPFASLGLPELNVTIAATGFEGIPDSLPAGRYLVSATAADGVDPGRVVAFVQPQGMSVDDFLSAIAGGGDSMASPAAASADSEGGSMMLPPFVYQAVMASGATAGGSANVIDLTPGDWFAWGDDPTQQVQPAVFSVTGDMPADLATPDSTATITLGEYVIKVTEGALAAGPQVIKIENIGAQPHFISLTRAPEGYTLDQATAALEASMSGTPPSAGEAPPVDLAYTPTQSTGTTMWTTWDLEPGVYSMMCFFPDEGDGAPHAMHGMYTVFEITG